MLRTLNPVHNLIQRCAGTHCGGGHGIVGLVVAADIDRLALNLEEFFDDAVFVLKERVIDRREFRFEIGIFVLVRERFGPVKSEVKVTPPVVDPPEATGWGFVFDEKLARCVVEGFPENFCLRDIEGVAEMLERNGKSEEFPERIQRR